MALFKLGSVVATPGALKLCEAHKINPLLLLGRHIAGDWGDLDAVDTAANVHAVQHDLRILSSYVVGSAKVWVPALTCPLMQSPGRPELADSSL